ncbi:MAG: hypothetical protein S4CHLAM2_18220 [Chlamydiales bacterium]|nr:hypothetical protein [Chlamydiales bacterium]
MFFPGIMETWRNPRSAENWGRAAVDVALIGLSTTKLGQASRAANTGRVGGEVAAFGKYSKKLSLTRTSIKQYLNNVSTAVLKNSFIYRRKISRTSGEYRGSCSVPLFFGQKNFLCSLTQSKFFGS